MLAYLVSIFIVVGIYALLTISLDLQYGYTGLINFGLVGFFALGAYGSALLALAGYPIALCMVAGMVVAMLAVLPIGLLTLRLREDYLAIVTLGFSETVRLIIVNEDSLTNGTLGLPGVPRPFSELGVQSSELAYLGLVLAINAIVILIIRYVLRSPFGRLLQAIRDSEVTVVSLGKSPLYAKMRALVLGAAIAGLAGALYAHYVTYVTPDQVLPLMTFYVWTALILGGVSSLRGCLIGALVLVSILEGTRFIRDIFPDFLVVEMASIRLALVGILMISFVLYRPHGLFGNPARR